MKPFTHMRTLLYVAACLFLLGSSAVAAAPTPAAEAPQAVVTVDGEVVDEALFGRLLAERIRSRYFHFKVPENEIPGFLVELLQETSDLLLQARAARERGLAADAQAIEGQVARADEANGDRPGWDEVRETRLAEMRQVLTWRDLAKQLEAAVRQEVPDPDPQMLRDYYLQYPEQFTEPPRTGQSLILVAVQAGAPAEAWQAGRDKANALLARLRNGEEFAALAREHSDDPTAANGGRMEYTHTGMLGGPTQQAIEKLEVGEVTDVIQVLEGFAILRLDERTEPRLLPQESVQDRLAVLWRREAEQAAWDAFRERLRSAATIEVDDDRLAMFREQLLQLAR